MTASPSGATGLPPAFFLPDGEGRYAPTDATSSPWDDTAMHGGPPTALLATCADEAVGGVDAGADGLRLARVTVDFLRPIPRRPFTVRVEVTRPGRRICAATAELVVDGEVAVRASTWHTAVRTGDPPPHDRAEDAAGPPAVPGPQPAGSFFGLDHWGHGEAIEWRFVRGGYDDRGPAVVWTRPRIPFLPDVPWRGFQHALMVADSTNGLSNVLPLREWLFIPPTLTVTLLRHPADAWVCVDAHTVLGEDGQGLARSDLLDGDGFLGSAVQPLLVARR